MCLSGEIIIIIILIILIITFQYCQVSRVHTRRLETEADPAVLFVLLRSSLPGSRPQTRRLSLSPLELRGSHPAAAFLRQSGRSLLRGRTGRHQHSPAGSAPPSLPHWRTSRGRRWRWRWRVVHTCLSCHVQSHQQQGGTAPPLGPLRPPESSQLSPEMRRF